MESMSNIPDLMSQSLQLFCIQVVQAFRSTASSHAPVASNSQTEQEIAVDIIVGGITNTLVRVKVENEVYIVRIFGKKSEHLINREQEKLVVDYLSQFHFGKQVHSRFMSGQIEEWIDGKSLTLADMRSSHIAEKIARKMAELHAIPIPDSIQLHTQSLFHSVQELSKGESTLMQFHDIKPNTSVLFPTIWKYYFICRQAATQLKDNPKFKWLQSYNFEDIKKAIIQSYNQLHSTPSDVVLCHGDLLSANILLTKNDSLAFIDFEYSCAMDRAYEIANHFNEYQGFQWDSHFFPSVDAQKEFIRIYAEELRKWKVLSSTFESDLFENVQKYFVVSHALWGLWSMIQAIESPIDFDFIGYTDKRLRSLHSVFFKNNLEKC